MSDHLQTGSLGEQASCDYLSSIGYWIIERNFRAPFGEIDIIAKDPTGILVIIEVKTLRSSGSIHPEDNLTRSKFRKLSRVASFYANKHTDLISPNLGYRIDLIAIVLDPTSGDSLIQKIGKNYFAVSHYKNVSL